MIEHERTAFYYIKWGIFLIWFIASLVALVVVPIKLGPWLGVSVFGQYFLVFGLIILISFIKDGNLKPMFLLPLLIGIPAVLYGLVMHFGNEPLKEAFSNAIPYVGLGIFFVTGVLSILSYFVRTNREKNCTVLVRAYCIDIKKRSDNSSNGSSNRYLYCPVFSFYYNGKTYEVCTNFYTAFINAELGKEYDMYINPDHPKCFKEEGESGRQSGLEIGIGISFMAISTLAFFIVLFLG